MEFIEKIETVSMVAFGIGLDESLEEKLDICGV
jgi:hypothetical protein